MLTTSDRAFLDALRGGQTAQGYAAEAGYSQSWAKWKSRQIRRKLGVPTLREAVAMSEITAEDLAAVKRELQDLKEAQARLEAARTPAAKEDARENVREAKADLDAELRQRGLSRADLDKLQEDKEYERFKTRQSRYEQERAEEEERVAREAEDAETEAANGKPKRKVAKAEAAPAEQPPKSGHFAERPLWGGGDK